MVNRLQNKIVRINALLRKAYGPKARRSLREPLDTLIETVLSQNTSDTNSHGAFLRLKVKFKSWEAAKRAGAGAIAKEIKSAGLYRIKSKRIHAILEQIHDVCGVTDLSSIKKMGGERAERFLKSFKGIGPKTLSIVMLFSLGLPYFPVDTHVLRVSKRLGLIPEKTNAKIAHDILGRLVPAGLMYEFHINVIEHGRKLCKASRPRCEVCPLRGICRWHADIVSQKL